MLQLGYNSFVPKSKVLAILDIGSRAVEGYFKGLPETHVVSACKGKKAKSVVIVEGGLAIKSAIDSGALRNRFERDDLR